MTTIYTLDNNGIYTGEVVVTDPYAPVPLGVAEAPPATQGAEVVRWNGGGWEVLAAYPVTAQAAENHHITKLAFRNRFTTTEKVMMELASIDNAAAPMAQRQQAAMLRVSLADTAAAAFIDLSRPDTRAGVQMLEAAGLVGVGRALEILDAPVLQEERPM